MTNMTYERIIYLWEDVGATWTWEWVYEWWEVDVDWATRDTWVKDWRYNLDIRIHGIIMKSKLISLWILWFVSTVIGWAVLQYPGFIERNTTIESWSMVAKLALDFGLTGGITGLVVGLSQSLTLHFLINEGKRWLLSTSIGYALGCPLGFVMAVILNLALAKINHVSLLGEDSSAFLAMPLITAYSGEFDQ
jgi:hypothetical protein